MIARLLGSKFAPQITAGLVIALGLALAAAAFAGNRWLDAREALGSANTTIKERDAALEAQVAESAQLAHDLEVTRLKQDIYLSQVRGLLEARNREAFEAREQNEQTAQEIRVAVSASECAPIRVPEPGIVGLQQLAARAGGVSGGAGGPLPPDPVPAD